MFGKSYINKIFIDSRYKTSDSKSDSDFVVELSENIELVDGIGCIVTDITLPHTWFNVNRNNNNLYLRVFASDVPTDYVITLAEENYNIFELAAAFEDLMSVAVSNPNVFKVEAEVQSGSIQISVLLADWKLQIFNDNDLSDRVGGTWRGPFFNVSNLKSLNSMLRINGLTLKTYDDKTPFKTGLIDLLAFHSIYLTSTKLSNFGNLGPSSQRNVIKKIMIGTNFGAVNVFDGVWSDDKINVSNLSLKLLDFQLRDVFGNVIDLNGSHISFSLLFVKM